MGVMQRFGRRELSSSRGGGEKKKENDLGMMEYLTGRRRRAGVGGRGKSRHSGSRQD